VNIQEFIRETLKQITLGVAEATVETGKWGALINPTSIPAPHGGQNLVLKATDNLVREVQFDIAVTVEEHTNKSGRGEVNVSAIIVFGGAKAEGNLEKKDGSSLVSRVKFDIPVYFPTHKNQKESHSRSDLK
jgi:hypothetical protein